MKFNRPKILRNKSIQIIEAHTIKWEGGEKFHTCHNPNHLDKIYYMVLLIQREGMSGPEIIFITSDEYYSFYSCCAKDGLYRKDCKYIKDYSNKRHITHDDKRFLCNFAMQKFPQMFK